MGQDEAFVDAARKEEVLKDVIEVSLRLGEKKRISPVGKKGGSGLRGEAGTAVFRERPGDDLEGRGKEDLGQLLISF